MMRKIVLSLILACLYTLNISGQEKFKPEWNVGIGFGPTFSAVDFDPSVSTKNLNQFHGGVSVRYITENHLGVIAELNYIQQGWAESFKEQPEFSHSHQLNYIELPLLTHIYFGNKIRYFINLGPKIAYLISDSEKMNDAFADYLASGEVSATSPTYQYFRKAEKKLDYGLMAGMGLEFRTGIGNFSLEGRYSFGFGDIYNNRKSDYFNRSANRVISAKLTYYVKLF
ncbi:porin family protein [Dysgonomonas sp. ZJ279]|uniref:porin family protein n=1 Tax=Dysgonomonas sp. ZJ279 TaxID=2709796 RepID=UPI0013ECBAB7|nr:porin family protein [Dysgonomonas sp. ZJ279]